MFAEQKCSRGHLSRRDKLSALTVLCGARSLQGAMGMWSRLYHPQVKPPGLQQEPLGRGCVKGLQWSQGPCVIQAEYSQEQDDAAKPFLGNVTVP